MHSAKPLSKSVEFEGQDTKEYPGYCNFLDLTFNIISASKTSIGINRTRLLKVVFIISCV